MKTPQPENCGDGNTISFTHGKSLNFSDILKNMIIKKYI